MTLPPPSSPTPLQELGSFLGNRLFVKRDDLLPFSFGGNKARKAFLFFQEVDAGGYDCVVTYGSGSSNHCRVVANLCARRDIPCHVIMPEETSTSTFNSQMVSLFGTRTTTVPVSAVHDTIEQTVEFLRQAGKKPYFIPGGGHGDIGTEAYVQCYREIAAQERELDAHFDFVFLASGTGTTQAGLVCGQLLAGDTRSIVGISIARKNPRGRDIVLDSIRSYLGDRAGESAIQDATVFLDDYTDGYGATSSAVRDTIVRALADYGLSLDPTYTGKAFWGMVRHLEISHVRDANILFIHTGGTPLFFDFLKGLAP